MRQANAQGQSSVRKKEGAESQRDDRMLMSIPRNHVGWFTAVCVPAPSDLTLMWALTILKTYYKKNL